jgi:hypothetical protein
MRLLARKSGRNVGGNRFGQSHLLMEQVKKRLSGQKGAESLKDEPSRPRRAWKGDIS